MEIVVRFATAQDRRALEEFYSREGMDFRALSMRASGAISETMYVVAVSEDLVVAALKLDISRDRALGPIGMIRYFEIEDELEQTDIGQRMLEKAVHIAEERGLRALEAVVSEARHDLVRLFTEAHFEELRRDIVFRRKFRARMF